MFSEEKYLSNENMTSTYFGGPFLTVSSPDDSKILQLPHNDKNNSQLSLKEILVLMSNCNSIRELSLPYSLLSDELVKAISNIETIHLETLRVEAYPESKPVSKVSYETWSIFTNNLPDVNFVLLTYLTEANDYNDLLVSYVPLTHIYFGDGVPSSVITRVGECCPYLKELMIGAYGPSTIDKTLLSAAKHCLKLTAVGLGDCELTCSGIIEFVSLCCERLKMLYVLDTSLVENSKCSIIEVSEKVSLFLGRSWQPSFVPYW